MCKSFNQNVTVTISVLSESWRKKNRMDDDELFICETIERKAKINDKALIGEIIFSASSSQAVDSIFSFNTSHITNKWFPFVEKAFSTQNRNKHHRGDCSWIKHDEGKRKMKFDKSPIEINHWSPVALYSSLLH